MLRRRKSMRATVPSGGKETQERSKPVAEHATRKVKVDTQTSEPETGSRVAPENQIPEKLGLRSEEAFRNFLRPPGLTPPKLSWVTSTPEVRPEERIFP